jgi:hypothetical protein
MHVSWLVCTRDMCVYRGNCIDSIYQHMQPWHNVSIAAMELCARRGLYGVRMVLCDGSSAAQKSMAWRCVLKCDWLYRRYVELSGPMSVAIPMAEPPERQSRQHMSVYCCMYIETAECFHAMV